MFDKIKERVALSWIAKQTGQNPQAMLQSFQRQSDPPKRGAAEILCRWSNSPWLRAVTSKISYHLAAVCWHAYVVREPNGQRRAVIDRAMQRGSRFTRRERFKILDSQGAIDEQTQHPAMRMLDVANPFMTGLNARKLTQTYLDLMGEAGWVIERTPEGLPAEFWPIPPTWVQQIATGAKPEFVVNFNGRSRTIPMNDMIWFRDPDPANPYGRGAGIGQSLGDEIDTDEYASKFIKSTFYNRARPDIIVAIEGAPTEALKVAEERWNNALRGAERTGRAYFQSGKMTVKELQQGFKELEMSKLREWERDTFISVYGVPPELLGVLTNSNRATITDARKIFAEEVIIPRLEFLRSELQLWVEREFDARLVIDYDNPHPDDLAQKLAVATAAPWTITVAEWRAMMGLESRGAGDNVQYIPLNLISQPAPIPEPGEEDLVEELDDLHDDSNTDELEDQARSARVSKAAGGVEIVLDALKLERLKAKLNPLFTDQVETWGNAALADVGATGVSFNMLNPMVTRYFTSLGEKIKGVNETTQGLVRLTLVDAIERGENPRVTARALRKQFAEFDKTRALTIARTEAHNAANFATNEAYRQTGGLVAGKEWITQFINSREDHEAADGQKVAVDQPFKVGGEALQYPGDSAGSAGNVINCRCTVVGVTDPSEISAAFTAEQRQAIWKAFDAKLAAFDKAAIAAVRAGFADQLKDLLKKFDAVFA